MCYGNKLVSAMVSKLKETFRLYNSNKLSLKSRDYGNQ